MTVTLTLKNGAQYSEKVYGAVSRTHAAIKLAQSKGYCKHDIYAANVDGARVSTLDI